MALFTDTAFEQRRSQVLNGATSSGGVDIGPNTGIQNRMSGFSDPSFEQRRVQILTPPQETVTKPSITQAVQAPPSQNILQKAAQFTGDVVKKISNGITLTLSAPKVSPPLSPSALKESPAVRPQEPIKIEPDQKRIDLKEVNLKFGEILSKINVPLQYEQEAIQTGQQKRLTGTQIIGGTIEDLINAFIPISGSPLKAGQESVKLGQRVISGIETGATFVGIHALIKTLKDEQIEVKDLLTSGGIGFWIGLSYPTAMKDISKEAEIGARQTLEQYGFEAKDFKNPDVLRKKFNQVLLKVHPDKGGDANDFKAVVDAYNKTTSAGIESSWKLPDIKEWVKNLWKDAKKSPDEKALIKAKAESDFVDLVKNTAEKKPEIQKGIVSVLSEGDHTPQEVIGSVIKSGEEKTPYGKEIIKAAVEAQDKGLNITVEHPKEIAPIELKVYTPEELKTMTPEQKQAIVNERNKTTLIQQDTQDPKAIHVSGFYASLTPEQSVALRNEVGMIPAGQQNDQVHLSSEKNRQGNDQKVTLQELANKNNDVRIALEKAKIDIQPTKTNLLIEEAKNLEQKAFIVQSKASDTLRGLRPSLTDWMTPKEANRYTEINSQLDLAQRQVRGVVSQVDAQKIIQMKRELAKRGISFNTNASMQEIQNLYTQATKGVSGKGQSKTIVEEAKKYKSAEEFKRFLSKQLDETGHNPLTGGDVAYHISNEPNLTTLEGSKSIGGTTFAYGSAPSGSRSGTVYMIYLSKIPKENVTNSGGEIRIKGNIPSDALFNLGYKKVGEPFDIAKKFFEKVTTTKGVSGGVSPKTIPIQNKPSIGVKSAISTIRDGLTLKPSIAKKPEEVQAEVTKLGLNPEKVIQTKHSKVNWRDREVVGYTKPNLLNKADFKTFVANSPEFKSNPVLTVNEKKYLEFKSPKFSFEVNPEDMQLQFKNLIPGDKIRVDLKALKEGKSQQMRVYKGNEVLGFNPKNLEEPNSPKAQEELKKIIKQSDIAKALSEKLGVPIRRGKFRHAGAIGLYKPGQKVVRIKSGGLQTVFHEVAHFLDDVIGFSKDMGITERKSLMSEYGYEYAGQKIKQQKEAFAEYIRFKLTGQTSKIDMWSPEFDKHFNDVIKEMPEVKEVLDTAQEDYKRWSEQPATAKILSQVAIGAENKGALKDRVVNTIHDLYTVALDDLHPLSEFSGLAKKHVGEIPSIQDPYILARNLRGWIGKADLFLNKGTFSKEFWKKDAKGNTVMEFKGKGYSEIMKPIEEKRLLNEFRAYIIAKRIVEDLAPRGIKSGISTDVAIEAVTELEKKYPEFKKVAEERRLYKDQLLEFARDNGLIGDEGLKKIKTLNKFHVPFYRVMEESQSRFMGKTKIAGNMANPIKKIKGSEREIIDPLESDVKDTYAIINAAERNNIGIAMANLASRNYELGRLFEEVARPMTPVKVSATEVLKKALERTDLTIDDLPFDEMEDAVTLFRTTYATGPNMLNVNLGDQQKVYQVDPDLFKAIQGLNNEDLGIMVKIMSFPAKLLRAGATLTPDFSIRNPIRDQFTAMVYSRYGFKPGIDLVRGMFELFKQGDVYNLWKAAGGEHAMLVSLDRTALQENLKEVLASKKEKALEYVKNPLKLLQIISEIGEASTRLGEMRQALRKGADPITAAYASRNVTLDFARIGAKTKAMNAITAFFNANLQGTDMMIRNFKSRPFQTLWKVLLGITLPSLLLYLANRDDKRFKEIPRWQKDLFWIVMTKDNVYRIPKPFELGTIFGSLPERVMEYLDNKDPYIFDQLMSTAANGFTPGFLPTGAIPIIENITNYSFFQNRPIVGRGMENLPPEAQANTYTSEVAKILGKAGFSPAKIDNFIQGYTGGLGKYAVSGIDKILTGTGIVFKPVSPSGQTADTPVLKAFMIRNPIGSSSESVNRIYDMTARINAEYSLVIKMVKSGETTMATQYVKSHPEIVYTKMFTGLVADYSQMNKAMEQIRNSKTMTASQKKASIDKIQTLQTDLARKTIDYFNKHKKTK